MWHRNDACFDDDWGEMGGGRRLLWKEMEGDMRGMDGCDLHGGGEVERERTRSDGAASDARSKPSEKCLCHVSLLQKMR